MATPPCSPLPGDQASYDYLNLLNSRVVSLFETRHATLTTTHLALTHLLHDHRTRCPSCRGNRNRYQTTPPSPASVSALAKISLIRLGVMSQRRLLQHLQPIARDLLCRRCRRSKTMPAEAHRIALAWVPELRRVVAMLAWTDDSRPTRPSRPPVGPVVDLTHTSPAPSHAAEPAICVICTDPIAHPAREKSCFQCSNVIHQSCFDDHRQFEDLNQQATINPESTAPIAERDVLYLPCVFCRCILLEVPRSGEGKWRWDERRRDGERADEEFARRVAAAEEEAAVYEETREGLEEWEWDENKENDGEQQQEEEEEEEVG